MMIKTNVTFNPNDDIEVMAELRGHGKNWSCEIWHVEIHENCRPTKLNFRVLEQQIIDYYTNKEADDLAINKNRVEYDLMDGVG